jgi:hypothetical protein
MKKRVVFNLKNNQLKSIFSPLTFKNMYRMNRKKFVNQWAKVILGRVAQKDF